MLGGQISRHMRCFGICLCRDKLSSAAAERWAHRGVLPRLSVQQITGVLSRTETNTLTVHSHGPAEREARPKEGLVHPVHLMNVD